MRRFFIFFIFPLIIPLANSAQNTIDIGLIPSLNINKKLEKDWSLNFKAESKQALISDGFNYDYLQTEVSFIAAKKIGINTKLAAGYLLKIDGEVIKNRAIQQISVIRRYSDFKLSHRFSADQTFETDDYTEFRFRYRVSTEIPLEGQSLDPKEFFIKLNNEYLNSIYQKQYDLEIRGAALLGYSLTPNSKLEIGADYRIDSFITGGFRNRLWIGLNFYQSF